MFPPCALVLFHFVLFLLCFPLGKLQLSLLLTLEKGLYLRKQDTGQGLWPLPRPFPRAALPLRREMPMSGSEIVRVQKEALQPQWLQGLSVSSGAWVSLQFSLYRLMGPPEKAGGPAARQVRLLFREVPSACIGKTEGKPRHRRIRRDPAAIAAAGPLFAPGRFQIRTLAFLSEGEAPPLGTDAAGATGPGPCPASEDTSLFRG